MDEISLNDPGVYKPKAAVKPETLRYLKGWRRPRYAYVLFEKRQFHLREGGNYTEGTGLFTLNVEHRPEQIDKLAYYTGPLKKFKLIDYGNFPKLNDPIASRAALARMHAGKNNSNPWDQLEDQIKHMMKESDAGAVKVQQLEKEKAGLEAKLAAALAKQNKEVKAHG